MALCFFYLDSKVFYIHMNEDRIDLLDAQQQQKIGS